MGFGAGFSGGGPSGFGAGLSAGFFAAGFFAGAGLAGGAASAFGAGFAASTSGFGSAAVAAGTAAAGFDRLLRARALVSLASSACPSSSRKASTSFASLRASRASERRTSIDAPSSRRTSRAATFLGAGGAPLHHRRHQAVVKTSERYAAAPGREHEPITFVSWADAEAYCAWAGKALPTEAEWERAAKGGAGERRFPWGDEAPTCERAVLFARVDCEPGVAPVGSRSPQGDSPDGCRDMAGNVAEWTADWYGPYSEDAAEDPTGPAEGTLRVMRGGNFRDPPAAVRTTARWGAEPTAYSEAVGFRCVFRP